MNKDLVVITACYFEGNIMTLQENQSETEKILMERLDNLIFPLCDSVKCNLTFSFGSLATYFLMSLLQRLCNI